VPTLDINLDPATTGSTTIVSGMSPGEILRKAEEDRLAAELMKQEMEGTQLMNLSKILDRAQSATERIERAADQIEIMIEVTQQTQTQIKEQAEEIKEILEPTPETNPAPAAPIAPAAQIKKSGLSRFLI
jgi:TolA-binding protein